jgi:hypothetical protein
MLVLQYSSIARGTLSLGDGCALWKPQIEFRDMRFELISALLTTNDTESADRAAEGLDCVRKLMEKDYDLYAGRNGIPAIASMDAAMVGAHPQGPFVPPFLFLWRMCVSVHLVFVVTWLPCNHCVLCPVWPAPCAPVPAEEHRSGGRLPSDVRPSGLHQCVLRPPQPWPVLCCGGLRALVHGANGDAGASQREL